MSDGVPSDPQVVRAAGHPLRREILTILDTTTASPNDLAAALGESLATICHHVAVLRDLGLLEAVGQPRGARQGQTQYRGVPSGEPSAGGALVRQVMELDAEGRGAASACVRGLWQRLHEIAAQSAARAAADEPTSPVVVATLLVEHAAVDSGEER